MQHFLTASAPAPPAWMSATEPMAVAAYFGTDAVFDIIPVADKTVVLFIGVAVFRKYLAGVLFETRRLNFGDVLICLRHDRLLLH